MKTNPLNTASDINEIVYIETNHPNRSSTELLINELGDFSFECKIELEHYYYDGDASVGEAYEFDVEKVDVTVLNVFDGEGEVIQVNKIVLRQIEKTLEKNLTFEITKKY